MKKLLLVVPAFLCALELLMNAPVAIAGDSNPINISVADAVSAALKSNLNLILKQHDVEAAEGSIIEAKSKFDTQLSADVSAVSEDNLTPVTVGAAEEEDSIAWSAGASKRFSPGTELELSWNNSNFDSDSNAYLFTPIYNTGLTLGVSQPLLQGRGKEVQTADLESTRTLQKASEFLVDSQAADLAADVKKAYWELVYSYQNLEVLQLALTLAEKLRDDTSAKIKAGKLASIDIYQPESEVARREEDLISGERAIGVAEDNLKLLMNSEDWSPSLFPVNQPETAPVHPEISAVLEKALAHRPDLQAAALQVKASEYQVRKAEDNTLPQLDLKGAVGIGGTDDSYGNAMDGSLSDPETQWQIGISFSRPLNNSLAEGRLRQAEAAFKKNRTSLELLKQEIRRTARVTVRDVELALKAIEATSKTAVATSKQLEAEQIKFDAGRSTTLDVLVAQQDYSNALSSQNRTKMIYAQTLAELDRIQGIISLPPSTP